MEEENFIKAVEKVKEKNSLDLSDGEDLSIALMNLVSLEEHCFFSYAKTGDEKFLGMLEKTREIRKELLRLIIKEDDGSEKWCMSKHFLAASMRLYETGNRFLHEKKLDEAKKLYHDAAELYGMFWVLNSSTQKTILKTNKKENGKIFSKIKDALKCCIE